MTVAALPAIASYLENGVTLAFPVPFRFKAVSDLVVERIIDGETASLTLGADYTVTGGSTDAGGTVTRTAATSGATLRIRRSTPRQQPMVYTTGDRFPAVSHESALDRQMLIAQEQDVQIADIGARAIRVPPGETAPVLPVASKRTGGKTLGFNLVTGAPEVQDQTAYIGPRGFTGPAGLAGRSSIGQVITEDQLAAIRAKIGPVIFGETTYILGRPTTIRPFIVVASIFNSHGLGQGARLIDSPGEIYVAAMRAAFPTVDIYHDNYSVPGSWLANYAYDQIDGSNAGKPGIIPAHAAAMAPGGDGRRRIPDIVLLGDPTNDALTTIFNSLQPPAVFRELADALVQRLQTEFGALVIGYTAPMWHPSRALANGRADMAEPFFVTYPKTGLVLGDGGGYQTLTYLLANQTISTNATGQFRPTLYDNGLLSFDGKSWIYVPEQAKFMRLLGVDETFSILNVDDGAGGPVITEDRVTGMGFYQAKFNATTQLIPAKNNPDFSRNVDTQPGVALAFEKRPYGPSGEMITVNTRLIELNQAFVGVLTKNKALLCDAAGEQRRALTDDAVFDELYDNNDDVHQGIAGHHLSYAAPTKKIVDAMAYGLL